MPRAVGSPVRRVEDVRFLTGTGRYVDDVHPRGLLYLAFVRSPYPAARIIRIDVRAAKAAPGVALVLTGDDIPDLGDVPTIPLPFAKRPPHPALARGRVMTVGAPVVCIAANSPGQARDAVDLVELDYEPEPS